VSPASWTHRCDPQSLSLKQGVQTSEPPASPGEAASVELPSRPPAPW
jgi:hypothetical protein